MTFSLKRIVSLTSILAVVTLTQSCSEEIKDCMEEVSLQTVTDKEDLSKLTCDDLLASLPDIANPPENYVTIKDKNVILVGHCSLMGLNQSFLEQLQTCYEKISDFLGINPITNCMVHSRSGSLNDLAAIEEKYVGGGAAGCFTIRGRTSVKEDFECTNKPDNEMVSSNGGAEEVCAYGHEPTHIFIAGTILQRLENMWLNEGLSDYVHYEINPNRTLECHQTTWKTFDGNSYSDDVVENSGNYVNLNSSRENRDFKNDAYKTAACLWKMINDEFGNSTFRTIMQKLADSRFNGNDSFVCDILEPTIGESGIEKLKNRFGDGSIEVYE